MWCGGGVGSWSRMAIGDSSALLCSCFLLPWCEHQWTPVLVDLLLSCAMQLSSRSSLGWRTALPTSGPATVLAAVRDSSDPKPCAKGDDADGDSDESDLDHMEIDAAEEAFDVDVEQVAAMLAAKKVETIKAGAEAEGPFAWRVMGGSWTKAHLGVD